MERATNYFGKDERRCSVGSAHQRSYRSKHGRSTQKQPLRVRSQSLFSIEHTEHVPLVKLTIPEASSEAQTANDGTVSATSLHNLNRATKRCWELNTMLLEAVRYHDVQEIDRLIKAGANPNATCVMDYVSASHVAALRTDGALNLLLTSGAAKERWDRFGRTPLHLAAWKGNMRQIAILLGFSEDLQNRIAVQNISTDTLEEVKKHRQNLKELVNVRCNFNQANGMLVEDWKDSSSHHDCKEFDKSLPHVPTGWTTLMVASACAKPQCVKLLLAAGADTSAHDFVGRTALDVAEFTYSAGQEIEAHDFAEVVILLLNANSKNITLQRAQNLDSPLHIAIELESLDAVKALLNAGSSISCLNKAGMTPVHLCVMKKLKKYMQVFLRIPNAVNERDKNGRTVLHAAVMAGWEAGVCIVLEAGANATTKDYNGETSIHLAATQGDVDVLNKLLSTTDHSEALDILNNRNETALFKAVTNGHTDCVKKILNAGASITLTLRTQINVFHIATERGYVEVLKVLLDHDYNVTRSMINFLTADDRKGFGPIHFAVQNHHIECVKVLLSRNAYVSLKTSYGAHKHSTPLHLAAINNNVEIAKIIIKFDAATVHAVNNMGWTPLHTASYHGSRDVIAILLKEGANLSSTTNGPNKQKTTAIDMIMNNLSKPTDFIEDLFDTYIQTNDLSIQDPNCKVTVDFSVLIPDNESQEQMKVIEALLKTGDRYDQRRLLLHPILESFLCLKWKALLPFFYITIILYGMFVTSLTMYTISVFFYLDTKAITPMMLNTTVWAFVVYITICLIILQEVLIMNIGSRYFMQLETWVKSSSLFLAIILPYSVDGMAVSEAEWPRHVATMALLLSWLEMTFLLSRFPNWGYYVLMFAKVSANVVKILLTFSFLVVGFALSFMVQFHSQTPFENPWAAFVKTMVMMTSEFDYDDLVDNNNEKVVTKTSNSLLTVRLTFLAFLIVAAIVLMNLMVGVAVNDIHNLQVLGNIKRLAKQVEFLGSLENLLHNSIFKIMLPNKLDIALSNKKTVLRLITLKPNEPSSKYYRALPSHIREAIFEKAHHQKKRIDEEIGTRAYKKKLDEIHEVTVNNNKLNIDTFKLNQSNDFKRCKDTMKSIDELNRAVADVKNQLEQTIQESKSSVDSLNRKIDIILDHITNQQINIRVNGMSDHECVT